MAPNRNRYLLSVSAELRAQATRVRDLIGDSHWLSDGHHKEYLLKYALARHVPSGVVIARGFVVHPQRPDLVSREQDLLFIDTSAVAPIFEQGGLCVAFPHQVLASIAVKTTFSRVALDDACDTLHSVRRVAAYAGVSSPAWCGVFFFDGDGSAADHLSRKVGAPLTAFEAKAERPTHMRATPDVVAIAGTAGFLVDSADATDRGISVRGFGGDGTIVLLNSLLAQLARARGSNGAEFEQFVAGFAMDPLPGSPFTAPFRGDAGSPSIRRKRTRRSRS
jgi:hypothetical protein